MKRLGLLASSLALLCVGLWAGNNGMILFSPPAGMFAGWIMHKAMRG